MKLSLQFLVSLTVAGLQAVPVSEPDPHHQPAPAHPLPPPQPASKIIASAPTVLCNLGNGNKIAQYCDELKIQGHKAIKFYFI